MDTSKKILILYAPAGHGHEKAARAVWEAFESLKPSGIEAETFDVLSLTPKFFAHSYRQGYLSMIQKASWLWGTLYFISDHPWIYAVVAPFRRLVNALMARSLERLILRLKPAAIVSTHFLSSEVAGALKRRKRTDALLVTVITDYLPHSFWLDRRTDFYVTAIEEGKEALERRGVSSEKIKVFGIPTEGKFAVQKSQSALREKFGLSREVFTALLTSGGAGVGAVEEMVSSLLGSEKKLQLLVVCGTNQELYRRLSERSQNIPSLKVFGFVDNVDELMEAADLVIGKGGGLTITESLCKARPIILFEPVPGQETRNAGCMVRHGAAFVATSIPEIVQKTLHLAAQTAELEKMKQAAARLGRPRAAREIALFVTERLKAR